MSRLRSTACRALTSTAVALVWAFPACRGLTVCEETCEGSAGTGAPDAAGAPNGGDASTTSGGEGGTPTASDGGSGVDGGGQAGADSGAGASAEGGSGEQACVYPRGECDGTLQTVCESDLTWNARRCGSCTHVCDGACSQATCGLEEPVLEAGQADAMLSDGDYYYFLSSTSQLVRVPRRLGELQIIASNLESPSEPLLALGGDSIYVWDGWYFGSPPQRVHLETGTVVTENIEASSFGATASGIFYVSDEVLWYRPHGEVEATSIDQRSFEILCSSPAWALLEEVGVTEHGLYLARGPELEPLGATPGWIDRAICSSGAAFLLGEAGLTRVSAEGVGPSAPFPQDRDALKEGTVVFDGQTYSLGFETRGNVNVRTFPLAGGDYQAIVGIPNEARLVHLDADFVWYNAADPPRLSMLLKRARLPGRGD